MLINSASLKIKGYVLLKDCQGLLYSHHMTYLVLRHFCGILSANASFSRKIKLFSDCLIFKSPCGPSLPPWLRFLSLNCKIVEGKKKFSDRLVKCFRLGQCPIMLEDCQLMGYQPNIKHLPNLSELVISQMGDVPPPPGPLFFQFSELRSVLG